MCEWVKADQNPLGKGEKACPTVFPMLKEDCRSLKGTIEDEKVNRII